MNILDKIINFFSPKHGAERLAWRNAYDSASFDNRNANWKPPSDITDLTLAYERKIALDRARDLERNTDLAESMIAALERNIIGQGIRLDGENEQLNKKFEDWANDPEQVELGGRFSFNELCKLIIRRTIVDGGLIIQRVTPTKREMNKYGLKVPLILMIREVDELSNLTTSFTTLNGIERDNWGRPTKYHFRNYDPLTGVYENEDEVVKASNIIYLFRPKRASQYREFTLLAPANERIKNVNELLDAELIKNKVNSCFSLAIERQTPLNPGRGTDNRPPNYSKKTLSPGMILELMPGEAVKPISPPNSASEATNITQLQQRLAGSGLGLSYELVSRDMSQSNYSSARQGLQEDKMTFYDWRNWLKAHFLDKLLEWFTEALFMDYKKEECNWFFSGWSWIDPQKEVEANSKALDSGQTTLAELCAESGKDWKDVIDQRAKEIEYCKSKGIYLDVSTNVDYMEVQADQVKNSNTKQGKQNNDNK